MARGLIRNLVIVFGAAGLIGCGFWGFELREAWRTEAEERCMAEGWLQPSPAVELAAEIDGPRSCGMTRPLKVSAIGDGFVGVEPRATLACPLVANLDAWFYEAVQPAAMAWLGEPVIEVRQISSYACRSMNGQPGAAISEHAFGNALDIAGFRFASGREITVKDGWRGRPEERGFLRQVHASACDRFTTVLGPGADPFHSDHFHVDLARRASGRTVCQPEPQLMSPPYRGVPVARQPARPAPAYGSGPTVISREPWPRSVGAPIGQSPAAAPIDARVMESLGAPQRGPASPPHHPSRPTPPANVPVVQEGTDPVVTGSAEQQAKPKTAPAPSPETVSQRRRSPDPNPLFEQLYPNAPK